MVLMSEYVCILGICMYGRVNVVGWRRESTFSTRLGFIEFDNENSTFVVVTR